MLHADESRLRSGSRLGDGYNLELLREMTGQLLDWGATLVGLKLGEDGLYLRTGTKSLTIRGGRPFGDDWKNCEVLSPCFEVKPVGTTGAGDCTYAGLLAALLDGANPAAAAVGAVAVGACCVESADATAGISTLQAISARIEQGWQRLFRYSPDDSMQWHETLGVWSC